MDKGEACGKIIRAAVQAASAAASKDQIKSKLDAAGCPTEMLEKLGAEMQDAAGMEAADILKKCAKGAEDCKAQALAKIQQATGKGGVEAKKLLEEGAKKAASEEKFACMAGCDKKGDCRH